MDAKKKLGVINSGLLSAQEKKDFEARIKSCPSNKRIAIITHGKADPDALSAMALTQLLEGWGFKSDIFSEGNISNPMNTTMISKLNIEIRNKKFFIENRDIYGLIILFDTGVSNCFLGHEDLKELIKKGELAACNPDIIIDHHPLNTIPKNCLIIKKEVGAAALRLSAFRKDQQTVRLDRLPSKAFRKSLYAADLSRRKHPGTGSRLRFQRTNRILGPYRRYRHEKRRKARHDNRHRRLQNAPGKGAQARRSHKHE